MRKTSGFTLIEILVVLAILGLLAAILFPFFGSLREKGRQSACQSNLQHIHKALLMYVQDHDSRAPSAAKFYEEIHPYTKSYAVFVCPSTPQNPFNYHSPDDHNIYGNDTPPFGNRYGLLSFIFTLQAVPEGNDTRRKIVGVNEAILSEADKILVAGDFPYGGLAQEAAMPKPDACGITYSNGKPDMMPAASMIHNGGGNYLFYDGHVKWLSPGGYADALCEAAPYIQPPYHAGDSHTGEPHRPSN